MSKTFRSLIGSALASAVACAVYAADVVKANNTTPLNQAGSWVGGGVPGAADVAVWDASVTGANALTYS